MGGWFSKEENVIVAQDSKVNGDKIHLTLTSIILALLVAAIIVVTCYYLLKKLRQNVVRHVRSANVAQI